MKFKKSDDVIDWTVEMIAQFDNPNFFNELYDSMWEQYFVYHNRWDYVRVKDRLWKVNLLDEKQRIIQFEEKYQQGKPSYYKDYIEHYEEFNKEIYEIRLKQADLKNVVIERINELFSEDIHINDEISLTLELTRQVHYVNQIYEYKGRIYTNDAITLESLDFRSCIEVLKLVEKSNS